MIHNEINDIIRLISSDKIVKIAALTIIAVSIHFSIFFSALAGICIISNYILGIIVCWCLVKYQTKASVCLQRLASFYKGHILPQKLANKQCTVCTNVSCNRHESHQAKHPWKNIRVIKRLNAAVEQFYNRIIETFVASWYRNFTDDVAYLNELKYSLRFASATAVNKFLEIDTGTVIVNKLIPCAIKHVDDYFFIEQIAKLKNTEFNDVAVEYLGKKLHVAATNRKNELDYLRYLSENLLPELLPSDYLKCRNFSVLIREIFSIWVLLPLMDVLSDPNIINSLVILITTYKAKHTSLTTEQLETVEFLENFVNKDMKNSSLALDLKTVIKTPQLLYAFMQYLKREGVVHLLQFCMDVEEFNNKLIMPDLSKRQLENLHTEALNLYKVYLDDNSDEFIGCSKETVISLKSLLQEGVYNVAKLRTSEPLFQAFDFAFAMLETDWLPAFYHSNEFYSYICGSKVTASYAKSISKGSPVQPHGSPVKVRPRKSYESSNQGTVSKISSGFGKIKGALRTNQPIEGAVFPQDNPVLEAEATTYVEDVLSPDYGNMFRDLSAWLVSIPEVQRVRIFAVGSSKVYYQFAINIQRIDTVLDSEIKNWTVRRKEQDFYTLKAKLIEFHGENEIADITLPSRKSMAPLEYRKAKYEEFLRKLLQKPSLKGSDLLHTFLTIEHDFTLMVTTAVPVGDLGNIYQSVAHKLRKEKGQHLDSFMNTFLVSTGRAKPNKFEWAEQVEEKDQNDHENTRTKPKTINNHIFNNNFSTVFKKVEESSSSSFNPNGITESMFYLLKHILKVPHPVLKLYAAICSVAQQAVESICRLYIERKLRTSLSQSNLAFLIGLLEGVIFEKHTSPTKEELLERKEKAFKELDRVIPNFVERFLGNNFKTGVSSLLTVLQNPLYNKQLAYNLLDIIIAELYPRFDRVDKQI